MFDPCFQSHIYHFMVSFFLFAMGVMVFGRKHLLLVFFGVVFIGVGKEVFDLTFNLHNMKPDELYMDSLGDMVGNLLGVMFGLLIFSGRKK